MTAAGQAIAAVAANQMPFTGYDVSRFEIVDIAADFIHRTDKLMPHMHGNLNRFLSPVIPVINVNIGAANGGFVNFNQNIVDADVRDRHIFQPDTRLRFGFDRINRIFSEDRDQRSEVRILIQYPGSRIQK